MNKIHPKISIVTPSYNQGRFIELAIKSLLEQGYPNIDSYMANFRWHKDNKSSISSKEQLEEKNRALLRHDHLLQQLPSHISLITRKFLELLARAKCYLLKGFKGYYFEQWQAKF